MKADQLMVPVYINEKIVLDMLAIIEDRRCVSHGEIELFKTGQKNTGEGILCDLCGFSGKGWHRRYVAV